METVKPKVEVVPPIQKHGQGLRALVEARRRELVEELSGIKKSDAVRRADIEAALSALQALLTGNLDQIPPVVGQELSQWIETSKYLGVAGPPAKPPGSMIADLRAYLEERRQQHELQLIEMKKSAPERTVEVETALQALKALLSGDLDRIPENVARELSECIETSKYLGTKAHRIVKH